MKNIIILIIVGLITRLHQINGEIQCDDDTDCEIENTNCLNNQCTCNFGYILHNDTICLPYVTEYLGKCEINLQCTDWLGDNSECKYNHCMCKDSFRWFEGKCKKYSGLNGNCQDAIDCYDGYNLLALDCSDKGKCECSDGFYLRDNIDCRKIANKTDDFCALDIDCHFENGICILGKCRSTSLIQNNDFNEDIQEIQIISDHDNSINCTTIDDCSNLPNSDCFDKTGTCVCKPGFYLGNENICIPEIGYNFNCNSDDDCKIKPSYCQNGACYCKDYWFTSNGNRQCIKTIIQRNWNCLSKEWCYALGPNSYCSSNETCECSKIAEFDENLNVCNKISNDTDLCITDYECVDVLKNSMCIDESCQCLDNYRIENDQCLPNIGASCDEKELPCTIEHSTCDSNKICSCIENYVTENNLICYPIASGLNENCEINAQCSQSIKNSLCKNNKCVCTDGYLAKNGICYEKKNIGSYCNNLLECSIVLGDSVVCRKGECQCPTGTKFIDEQCTSSGRILMGNSIAITLLILLFQYIYN